MSFSLTLVFFTFTGFAEVLAHQRLVLGLYAHHLNTTSKFICGVRA
jgi:hypothetical protein